MWAALGTSCSPIWGWLSQNVRLPVCRRQDVWRSHGRRIHLMSVTLRVSVLRSVCAPALISTLGQKVGKCLWRYILVCDVNSVCGHGRTIHLASVTLRVCVLRSLCVPVLISTLGQKVGRLILVCDVCGHGRRIHLASVTLRVSVLLSVCAPLLLYLHQDKR